MKNEEQYISKATTISIKASSRASIKISENYYTVEWTEERSIPEDADVDKERTLLWEDCNSETDNQVADIIEAYGKKRSH